MNGIAVDPADPDHAYVIFSGYREGDNAANIWETTNGGAFWTNISGNLPNAPLDAVVFDSDRRRRDRLGRPRRLLPPQAAERPEEHDVDAARDEPAEHVGPGHQDPGLDAHALRDDVRPRRADDPAAAAVPVRRVHAADRESAGAEQRRTRSATVPVKFSLGGNYGPDVLADGYPQSVQIYCTTLDPIAGTPAADERAALGFEAGQYKYLWKTDRAQWRARAGSSS